MTTKIQGVQGSFQIEYWHVGDDIRIRIEFSQGDSHYFRTNRTRVNHLWIPGLTPYAFYTNNIEDGNGVSVSKKDGNYYLRPPYSGYGPQGVAIFTPSQMKQIIAVFERPPENKTVKESQAFGLLQMIPNALRSFFATGGK